MNHDNKIDFTYIDNSEKNYSGEKTLNVERRWLVGSPKDDEWVFTGHDIGKYYSNYVFEWKPTFALNNIADKVNWHEWKRYGKKLCTFIFDEKQASCKTSSFKNYAVIIKALCEYFCFVRLCGSLSSVQKGDVEAYEAFLEHKKLSQSHVGECLRNLRYFWVYKTDLKEGLSFDPYSLSNSLTLKAKKISRGNGHTPTLKPEEGLKLIDHALNLISKSEDTLERFDFYIALQSFHDNPGLKFFDNYNLRVSEFIKEVQALYGASIVIVLGLSAMRKHETNQIRYEDALALLDPDISTLTGKVLKTSGTKTGLITEREMVKEVEDAIKIIIRLTKPRRDKCKSEMLLLRLPFHDSIKPGTIICHELGTNSFYLILDVFSKSASYENRALRPHMFRRFFAMMWAWRFETGDLHYLSELLFHNGFQFTTAYTEDKDVWLFIPDEIKRLTYKLFEETLLGEKEIVGGFSRTIQRYMRLIKANVTVITPENIQAFVDTLLERGEYIVTPAADGYCFMNKSRGGRAKCSTNGKGPNYSNRNESLCSICGNFGVTDDRKSYWKLRYDAHEETYVHAFTEELKKTAKEGMALTMRMIKNIEKNKAEND